MPVSNFSPPCPNCGYEHTKVVTTMRTEGGEIMRRRCCQVCDHRFYGVQPLEYVVENHRLQFRRNRSTSGGVIGLLDREVQQ